MKSVRLKAEIECTPTNGDSHLRMQNDRLRRQLSEFELAKVKELGSLQEKLTKQHDSTIQNLRYGYEN
jgi:regulator of replication initiation timing